MSLYEHIGPRYEELFPVAEAELEAIEGFVPPGAGRKVLDLGAAAGGHSLGLALRGWDCLGIELDPGMAARACAKAASVPRAKIVRGSALDAPSIAESLYGKEVGFDLVLCLGNTLPHLPPEALPSFLASVRKLLAPGSPFLVQTLNYSHPRIGPGFVFPDIAKGDLVFRRRYLKGEKPGDLVFATSLSDAEGTWEDRTILHPVPPALLSGLLAEAGFREVEGYSGWGRKPFDPLADLYLIAAAR